MKTLFLITIFLTLLFSSCKKDPYPVETGLTDAMARDSLYFLMRQWYFWYDKMPVVKKEVYSDPYELMNAMRYPDYDKWSFVADYDDRNELCLNEAIHYLENGTFSAKGFDQFYRYPQYSEKPAWRNSGLSLK